MVRFGTVIMSEPKSIFGSTPGAIVATGTACVLLVGACVLCGGALSFPFLLRSQRQAEEAPGLMWGKNEAGVELGVLEGLSE